MSLVDLSLYRLRRVIDRAQAAIFHRNGRVYATVNGRTVLNMSPDVAHQWARQIEDNACAAEHKAMSDGRVCVCAECRS